ncbi:PBSX family phage terminase large subunit [Clostridia bacterium]|nr:PBSX family phage terminase large subunit [Clostridia bacterium]
MSRRTRAENALKALYNRRRPLTIREPRPEDYNEWVYNVLTDYSRRLEVYYGGAGSGKSYGAFQKILYKAIRAKRRVLVIRKIEKTLKSTVFELMRQLALSSGQLTRINKSDKEIELSNGSVFLFKGLDDPEKIKSIVGITDIIIEEATELTIDDFTQLNLRLRPPDPNPQIYLCFNPVSKVNWVYNYFIVTPPSNAVILNTSYADNRFLTQEYRDELERLKYTNPAYYRIYALGEFATLDKLVFPIIQRRIIPESEVAKLPRWCGLDYGFVNDPTALTWGHYDAANKRIYTVGEYHRKGMTNADIAETVKALGLSQIKITADSVEPKSNYELRRLGLRVTPAKKGPDSVRSGLDWMFRHEIVVDERCIHTLEEYENYTWVKDKRSGEYINRPVDAWNHHIDGTRYGLEAIRHAGGTFVTVKM